MVMRPYSILAFLISIAAVPAATAAPESDSAVFPEPIVSRVSRGRIGVGLNFPGLGVRALIGTGWLVEARAQYEKEGQVVGGRVYRYVYPAGRIYPYVGLEGDYVKFKGSKLKAEGAGGEVYAGVEVFIRRNVSIQGDIGPAYVGLKRQRVTLDGMRYVVNFGITYYM
jgi:hypothetical protein